MRVLIIDHFFKQDIAALEYQAQHHRIELLAVEHWTFLRPALRCFPEICFAKLDEYRKPEYGDARRKYQQIAFRIMQELWTAFPFQVLVLPDEAIFYFRDLIEWCHDYGLPVIIVEKETVISPDTMQAHTQDLRNAFEWLGDGMTVCSERLKAFWVASGYDSAKIVVRGQPRFDFYCQPERWYPLSKFGITPGHKKVILFFSYDTSAYVPIKELSNVSWIRLRQETEQILFELARGGDFLVLIKPHPQQDIQDYHSLLAPIKDNGETCQPNVYLLPNEFDTRQLIINADVVVGFQTTALFEAGAAGKPTFYTFWTDNVVKFAPELIPFHLYQDLVHIVHSPLELKGCLNQDLDSSRSLQNQAVVTHLGGIDGKASERVLEFIMQMADAARPTETQRQKLEALRFDVAKRGVKSGAAVLFWKTKIWLPGSDAYKTSYVEHMQWHAQTARTCFNFLMGR